MATHRCKYCKGLVIGIQCSMCNKPLWPSEMELIKQPLNLNKMIKRIQLTQFDFECLVAGEEISISVPGEKEERLHIQIYKPDHNEMVQAVLKAKDEAHKIDVRKALIAGMENK